MPEKEEQDSLEAEKEEIEKTPIHHIIMHISFLSFLPSLLLSLLLCFTPLHRSIALSPTPQPMRLSITGSYPGLFPVIVM